MKKGDYLVIAAVLLASLIWFASSFAEKGEKYATVYCDGQQVKTVCLSEITETEIFSVNGCEIYFDNEGVFFAESDCEDKLCIKRGRLSKNGDSMACVPNRVVVTVTADKGEEYDIMAY